MIFRKTIVRRCFSYTLWLTVILLFIVIARIIYRIPEEEKNLEEAQKSLKSTNLHFTNKTWYFSNGVRLQKKTYIFPWEDPNSDRITNQLMYIPPNYEQLEADHKYKTILLYNGLWPWYVTEGRDLFTSQKCSVSTCMITANHKTATTADLILFDHFYTPPGVRRHPKQIYMLYILKIRSLPLLKKYPDVFNWTATYRMNSEVVIPYGKWEYYDPNVKQMEQNTNFAFGKTKKVVMFVSNCEPQNDRLNYARELQEYIEVDINYKCGNFTRYFKTSTRWFDGLHHNYKFYLAFENVNCKDYITEKFFINALNHSILPIVMGAPIEDYERSAPYKSYIHVDEFSSPKALAEYLNILDKNDELYNSYFKWKGTGELINTYFWCRLCAVLHNEDALKQSRHYDDINEWWSGKFFCTNGSWRPGPRLLGRFL